MAIKSITLGGRKYKWEYSSDHIRTAFGTHADGIILEGHDGKPGTIAICSELDERRRLEVEIHEALHAIYPELSEEKVTDGAKDLARLLHRLGYTCPQPF